MPNFCFKTKMSGTHNSPKRFTTPNSRGKETVIAPQPQPQLQQAQPQTQPSKVPIQRESEVIFKLIIFPFFL